MAAGPAPPPRLSAPPIAWTPAGGARPAGRDARSGRCRRRAVHPSAGPAGDDVDVAPAPVPASCRRSPARSRPTAPRAGRAGRTRRWRRAGPVQVRRRPRRPHRRRGSRRRPRQGDSRRPRRSGGPGRRSFTLDRVAALEPRRVDPSLLERDPARAAGDGARRQHPVDREGSGPPSWRRGVRSARARRARSAPLPLSARRPSAVTGRRVRAPSARVPARAAPAFADEARPWADALALAACAPSAWAPGRAPPGLEAGLFRQHLPDGARR